MKKQVAWDYDRTLVRSDGSPIRKNVEALKQLRDEGYHPVVHTARTDRAGAKRRLKSLGVNVRVTNRKPKAVAYVDDRAVSVNNRTTTSSIVRRVKRLAKRRPRSASRR